MPVYYFLTMLFLLFAGSLIITGWYASTRGEISVNADGSIEKTGYIFKAWYFFWYKEKGTKRIEFKGDQFTKKLWDAGNFTKMKLEKRGENMFMAPLAFELRIPDFEKLFNCKVSYKEMDGSLICLFYEEEPTYVHPEWVRTVMAGCITCHASIYGTIIFLVANYFIFNSAYFETVYLWCNQPLMLIIASWIGYVFSLAYLNTILWNKFKFAK